MNSVFVILLMAFNLCFMPSAGLGEPQGATASEELRSADVSRDANDLSPMVDEISVKDMDVKEAIELVAKKSGLNIVTGEGVQGRTTIFLKNVDAKEVLRMILEANNLAYAEDGGIIRVMTASEYTTRFGHVFGQEKVTKMIKVHFVPVKELVLLLEGMKSDEGKVITSDESKTVVLVDSADRVRAMESLIRQIDVQTVTSVLPLKYARAQDILERVRGMVTQSMGSVECDTKANQLVVTDALAKVEKIRRTVEEMDAMSRKIVLEAKLVHIDLDSEHLGGVDWEGIVENYQNIRLTGRYDFLDGEAQDRILSLGTIAGSDLSTLLEALDTVGVVQEYPLSAVTISQDEAVHLIIHFDEPDLELSKVRADVMDEDIGSSSSGNAALEFYVRPKVGVDDKIEISVQSRTWREKSPGERKAPAEVIVAEENSTVVLGGLIATEKIATTRKIPLMGDLPLLGFAFRFQNSSVRREEFVVLLSPRIVSQEEFPVKNEPLTSDGSIPGAASAASTKGGP